MSDSRDDGYVRRVAPQDDRQSRRDDARGGSGEDDAPSRAPGESGDADAALDGGEEMVKAYGGGEDDAAGADGKKSNKDAADPAEDGEDDDKKKKKKKSSGKDGLMKRLKQMRQALAVAKAAHQGMVMAQMAMYLKAFLQMMMMVAQAAAAAVAGAVAAVIQTIVSVATTVATAIGVSVAVAAGGLAMFLVAAVLVVAVAVSRADTAGQRDAPAPDCNSDASYMTPITPGNPAEEELANAKIVYAFFKAYGLPDENIAGILGNWTTESHIDPTGTETIFSEPFTIPVEGTRKYNAWQGMYYNSHGGTRGPVDYTMVQESSPSTGLEFGLVSLVDSVGGYNDAARFKNYHAKYPAIQRIGIGLGQWTNARNQMLLDFADNMGMNWYDLETQLMFMICLEGGDSRAKTMAGWKPESTAESAARWFYAKWEGGGGGDPAKTPEWRIENANAWFTRLKTWVEGVDYDMDYARSLLAAVANAGAAGGDKAGSSSLRSCSGLAYGDNSSAAKAAVAFSWGPGDKYDNDGTSCWMHLADALYAGDVLYRSCDRTVAAALWWSGTDTEFPKNLGRGMNSGQLGYLTTADNWVQVSWDGDYDELLPGDVLIRSDLEDSGVHHVVMYVGPDAVVERFGERYNGLDSTRYYIASGSAGQYSPHVNGPDRTEGTGFQTYYVFRCTRPNNVTPEKTQLTCVG